MVEQLAEVNDSGRFNKPKAGQIKQDKKYDNDLFQTGRLITCGLYINCILKDYVRTILNLNRSDSAWDLDPRVSGGESVFGGDTNRSVGNQVSAEFNLVYRWHAAVSEKDDKWTQQEYKKLFPDKNPADVKVEDLLEKLKTWGHGLSANPHERPFANLSRDDHGNFRDDDLVEILAKSIEDIAGAFGANKVPQVLRSVEILGIRQARSWNLATLNEFRTFFGLTKHETFESINKDVHVANQLKHLYDHPDFVELYPGLVVEEAKEPQVGSGLCPSYTVSRAILSDAVALVRGDRFYMVSLDHKADPLPYSSQIDRLHAEEPHQLGLQRSKLRCQRRPRTRLLQIDLARIPEPLPTGLDLRTFPLGCPNREQSYSDQARPN